MRKCPLLIASRAIWIDGGRVSPSRGASPPPPTPVSNSQSRSTNTSGPSIAISPRPKPAGPEVSASTAKRVKVKFAASPPTRSLCTARSGLLSSKRQTLNCQPLASSGTSLVTSRVATSLDVSSSSAPCAAGVSGAGSPSLGSSDAEGSSSPSPSGGGGAGSAKLPSRF